MRSRIAARWINDDQWVCMRHMRSVILPATTERCWFRGCSERPARPDALDEEDPLMQRAARARAAEAARLAEPPPPRPSPQVVSDSAPKRAVRVVIPTHIQPVEEVCSWDGCDQLARPRSKYCSRNCSNKNARARHNNRGKRSAA